ncbi:hypothetical protein [Sphingobium cupriresistens]|uniref:Uncharacterized protein n=1 Tax=Sphingobium cupriresistens TaxID=1132417 RepID=A0A8G2DXL1_9SPHN|nr:hypothetical protein [Sphingobium cupriresistens]RYM05719.1 hypothetical protein EWH12_20970 [Sphingobium cupriresistens]
MFYPKCPQCGGKTTSAEPNNRYAKHAFGQWLQQQAAANYPHPYLKAAVGVVSAGNEIYKRLPGGGLKRCKSCGHQFN